MTGAVSHRYRISKIRRKIQKTSEDEVVKTVLKELPMDSRLSLPNTQEQVFPKEIYQDNIVAASFPVNFLQFFLAHGCNTIQFFIVFHDILLFTSTST